MQVCAVPFARMPAGTRMADRHRSHGDGPEDDLATNLIQAPFEAAFPAEARS